MITVPWWLPAVIAFCMLVIGVLEWDLSYKSGHADGREAEHIRQATALRKAQLLDQAVSFTRRNNPPSQWDTGPLLLERFDRMIGSRETGELQAAPDHKGN
jgi:hypothetical protein